MKAFNLAAEEVMEKLSLKKRIQAALLEHNINPQTLHIDIPEKGVVEVGGYTESEEDRKSVMEAIEGVKGVTKVKGDIGTFAIGI